MTPVRLIPRLDVKGPNLVKGIHLEGLRVLGKPERFARFYYEQGADELVYMDVVASLYGRNNLLDIVTRTARETFVPLAVGGGIRSLDDIRDALRAGADKVIINTAAIARPAFIREAAERYGSSTIVISVEAVRSPDGRYEAYTDNGRERTGVEALEWACRAAELGAGEIMITSVDREGTAKGFDVVLTAAIADAVPIPVIACGGAGTVNHLSEVILAGHADAVCVASLLHYGALARGVANDGDDFSEGNVEFLRGARGPSRRQGVSIQDIKAHLADCGIKHRPNSTEVSIV